MRIAVTGATGGIGGRVARRLAERGVEQTLLARRPAAAPDLAGARVVRAEYRDGDAVRAALDGCDVVLMVSGSESADRVREHLTFVDAAVAAGVRHVVYTSFLGAAPDCTFTLGRDHFATEQALLATGVATTMLRDSLYADFLPMLAGDDGVIRGPAGQGRVAAVARDDVADVAATVLLDLRAGQEAVAAHAGASYDLTGPQSLTLAEAAETITRVTGRAVRYEEETPAQAYASRAPYGAPDWQVDAWVSTYTAIAAGELDRVSGDVERVTGHPATSLEALLRSAS